MVNLDDLFNRYPDVEFLIADGFNEAIIGVDETQMRLIYSMNKCIDILCREMEYDEALEYFSFNIHQAYVGDKTPIWCVDDFQNE